MDDDPTELLDPSPPPAADDGLHLRVSRRALRRAGLVALLVAVAAVGLGAGLLLTDDDSGDSAERAVRKGTTTTTTLVTTTVPSTAAPGADASGSGGATESVGSGDDGADPEAAAEPGAEAPAAEPVREPPTLSISLTPIPLGCAGIGPTLEVSWSTDTGAVVQLNIDDRGYGVMQPSGALVVDVDCGREVVVRGIAGSDHGASPLVAESIVIIG